MSLFRKSMGMAAVVLLSVSMGACGFFSSGKQEGESTRISTAAVLPSLAGEEYAPKVHNKMRASADTSADRRDSDIAETAEETRALKEPEKVYTKQPEREAGFEQPAPESKTEAPDTEPSAKTQEESKAVTGRAVRGASSSGGASVHTAQTFAPESKGAEPAPGIPESKAGESEQEESKPKLPEESKPSEDKLPLQEAYFVLSERCDAGGILHYPAGERVFLEDAVLIGRKANGENTGKALKVKWTDLSGGEELQKVQEGVRGRYTLVLETEEDFILQDVNDGRLRFAVPVHIE